MAGQRRRDVECTVDRCDADRCKGVDDWTVTCPLCLHVWHCDTRQAAVGFGADHLRFMRERGEH